MPRLPVVTGKEVSKLLIRHFGFYSDHKKGSHEILKKTLDGVGLSATVPWHDELDIGTFLSILRQAHIT